MHNNLKKNYYACLNVLLDVHSYKAWHSTGSINSKPKFFVKEVCAIARLYYACIINIPTCVVLIDFHCTFAQW